MTIANFTMYDADINPVFTVLYFTYLDIDISNKVITKVVTYVHLFNFSILHHTKNVLISNIRIFSFKTKHNIHTLYVQYRYLLILALCAGVKVRGSSATSELSAVQLRHLYFNLLALV